MTRISPGSRPRSWLHGEDHTEARYAEWVFRRDVFYAHEGAVRRRHLQEQTEQAWCLTIATNAISTWTAEYLGLAVAQLRAQGRHVDDEVLAHISPAQSESVGLFGTISVDIDAELAQLGPTGHRPLRSHPRPSASADQAVP